MADCPNEEFAKYILTVGGLTLDDPTGAIAGGHDYGEWYALAGEMRMRMETDWRALLAGAEEVGYPPSILTMQNEVEAIRLRHISLVQPWDFFDFTQIQRQISDVTSVVHDIVCTWQRIDELASELDVDMPDHPRVIGEKPGMGLLGWSMLIAGGFGVGYGIYHYVNRKKGRNS
jgi:hypothetical protein